MSWPALVPPTPTIVDSFRSYAVGSVLGYDTALDKWSVHPTGMQVITGGWQSIKQLDGRQLVPNGPGVTPFSTARWIGDAVGPNHFSAVQSIGALGWACGGNAVRCDPATDTAYCLFEQCAPHTVMLVRRRSGVDTILATWFPDSSLSWPGGRQIMSYQDDHLWVLEVVGTNPVELRASVWLNRLHETYDLADVYGLPHGNAVGGASDALMVVPDDIWDWGEGPAGIVIGTYTDASASRITAGGPGLAWTGGINDAGGLFGFSAGELPVATLPATLNQGNKEAATTATPDADGTSVDIGAGQLVEWTVDAGAGGVALLTGADAQNGGGSGSDAVLVNGVQVATVSY